MFTIKEVAKLLELVMTVFNSVDDKFPIKLVDKSYYIELVMEVSSVLVGVN